MCYFLIDAPDQMLEIMNLQYAILQYEALHQYYLHVYVYAMYARQNKETITKFSMA